MSGHTVAPDALIEAYVGDVIRRLPRRQRNDIGFELRALLNEGLRERAADAGRLPDEAMALDFLREFGAPDDVAARYAPPGIPVIPPAQTRGFVWATFIGIGLQWATSLPLALSGELAPSTSGVSRLGAWWVTYGLGAFWWPGFLVTVAMIAGFVRQRWPARADAWSPRIVDRDHVNRPLYALGLAAALAGIGLWVAIAWYAMSSSTPFARALAFDSDFLATRAPVVLLYWAVGLVPLIVAIAEGRWRSLTRRINTGIQIAGCLLMLWFILGGPIFTSEAADQMTKGVLGLIILLILLQFAIDIWRNRSRIRPPQAQRG